MAVAVVRGGARYIVTFGGRSIGDDVVVSSVLVVVVVVVAVSVVTLF